MSDITRVLALVTAGRAHAADDLLPLVYEDMRRLAARKMAHERGDHTLTPTSLVHEAYLRLVQAGGGQTWDDRRHFFAAAAEAMRRILVENARRKKTAKHGGEFARHDVDDVAVAAPDTDDNLLAVHEALDRLATQDAVKAELVKLRFFAGLTAEQAADVLGISVTTADRYWAFARAWLFDAISGGTSRRGEATLGPRPSPAASLAPTGDMF